MKNFLAGWKTWCGAALMAIAQFTVAVGLLTQDQANLFLALGGALGFVGLHAQNERQAEKSERQADKMKVDIIEDVKKEVKQDQFRRDILP